MLTELSTEIIDHMLHNQYFGRIGCSAENRILIEPVMFFYDGLYIYGITRAGTKIDMVRKNPNVAFEIDEMISLGVWHSVLIEGEFEELHDELRDSALYLLKNRKVPVFANEKPGTFNQTSTDAEKTVHPIVYRIHIKSKAGRRLRL